MANTIFGGYFSSRWTENIREDKGYTYGPHSRLEQTALGGALVLDADVATEVTAPALLETLYELGRLASLPVTPAEVEAVRQYLIGTIALSTATQAGLASNLVDAARQRARAGLAGRAFGPAGQGHGRRGQRGRGRVLRAGPLRRRRRRRRRPDRDAAGRARSRSPTDADGVDRSRRARAAHHGPHGRRPGGPSPRRPGLAR